MNKDNIKEINISEIKIENIKIPPPIHNLNYRWFKIKDGKYIEYNKEITELIENSYKNGKRELVFENCFIDFIDFTERRKYNSLIGLRLKRISNENIENNKIENKLEKIDKLNEIDKNIDNKNIIIINDDDNYNEENINKEKEKEISIPPIFNFNKNILKDEINEDEINIAYQCLSLPIILF